MTRGEWPRWIIARLDQGYRALHALDAPAAQVGPALCVEVHRSRRTLSLADGTAVRRGDPVAILHLNNRRIAALHHEEGGQRAVGLLFRRRFVDSLEALAARARDGGDLAHLRAFAAVTVFGGLERVGFAEAAGDRLCWARCVAAYQRGLLAALRPAGAARPRLGTFTRARRLWISRERLLALHGPARARRAMPMG
ncbi:MAG: hypothetical protein A2X52_06430 [Candidatus Rokubacteria bacterium GWC2_70_16]|nr:MAG: hypothetical protein A2X52_06430 [Candidatus Rokubacteria bacterium GWC2_70_16]OGL13674.1 MAG: hypothetical protein A3K12_14990 [Candidatus Rokubacteria bacterium RIFCSPLOWO2_12_FULL_71_19]